MLKANPKRSPEWNEVNQQLTLSIYAKNQSPNKKDNPIQDDKNNNNNKQKKKWFYSF